ncbi:MAG: hypothetical protein DWH82_04370 [Planctomycetota bacterium]|nr:MAG: hypothetical protein DWH82_04370 [Planctomycetota bacterium]
MAKSPVKESNTGLIIVLVFFILSTLGLGVGTYMGFAEQKKFVDIAKDAETKKKDSDDRKRLYAAQAQLLYKYIANKDLPIAQDDKMEIPTDRINLESGGAWASKKTEGLIQALQEIENAQAINGAGKQEKILGVGTVVTPFLKVAELTIAQKKQYEASLQTQRSSHDKSLADLTQQFQDDKKILTKRATDSEDRQKKVEADFLSFRKAVTDLQAQEKGAAESSRKDILAKLDAIAGEALKEAEARKDGDINALRKSLAEQRRDNDRLKNDMVSAKLMKPSGWKVVKITREDPRLVYINLGSQADVRPGDFFFIHGNQDNGIPEQKPKGKLEVVRVIDAKLSVAAVTQIDNAGGNPVREDDHLNNPIWSPNMRQNISSRKHIALRGQMFIDGSDIDSTIELVKRLEDMGVIVDSYIDFKDKEDPLKVGSNSTGLSEKTSLVIEGADPFKGKVTPADKVSEAMFNLDNRTRDFNIQRITLDGFIKSLGWTR